MSTTLYEDKTMVVTRFSGGDRGVMVAVHFPRSPEDDFERPATESERKF